MNLLRLPIRAGMRQTMQTVHGLLRGEISAEEAAGRLGVEAERARVYQRFVRGHIEELLEKNYPILRSCLSEEVWSDLVARFFDSYPADSFELNANAAVFPELVAASSWEEALGLSEFHEQLARLEWQELVAYFSPELIPSAAEIDGPTLNPTLAILNNSYPVGRFVEEQRSGGSPPIPEEIDPEQLLVFREPETDLAVFYRAEDDLLFALKMIHERVSSARAAELSGLPEEAVERIVERAAEIGLVILPLNRP